MTRSTRITVLAAIATGSLLMAPMAHACTDDTPLCDPSQWVVNGYGCQTYGTSECCRYIEYKCSNTQNYFRTRLLISGQTCQSVVVGGKPSYQCAELETPPGW